MAVAKDVEAGLPSEEKITQAADMPVYDSQGNKVQFGDIFKDQRSVVVFIRHFFCGACQAYASQLATVSDEALSAAGVKLVLIGCGEHQAIKSYADTTGFKGAIYADPERKLFHQFGLIENLGRTPSGEQRKSYLAGRGLLNLVFSSIWKGPIKNPHLIGKQGNISQLGGEFIFGPSLTCTFASRMKHSEDHVDVADLMKEAGVAYV